MMPNIDLAKSYLKQFPVWFILTKYKVRSFMLLFGVLSAIFVVICTTSSVLQISFMNSNL
jgi:hypothetical protein